MSGFFQLGFPHCVGAIDGSHIPIRSPCGVASGHGNGKNFSSLILQGTVDHTGRFIDAEVAWGGRAHYAHVFKCSSLCRTMDAQKFVPGNPRIRLEGVDVPPLILGDGAYPLRPWLMTPFRSPRDRKEVIFNCCHSRARCVVEHAFGRLKARWRCLSSRLALRPENLTSLIAACVVLHNICEEHGHAAPDEPLHRRESPDPIRISMEPNESYDPSDQRNLPEGKAVRRVVANLIMQNQTDHAE